jgi:hypothetical protein
MNTSFPTTLDHPCQSRHLPGAVCVPVEAWCHRCCRVTPTALLNLRSGLIGNACAECRTCRRIRPYLGRWDRNVNHDAGATGQGENHEHQFIAN